MTINTPITGPEARALVAILIDEATKRDRIAMLKLALGPAGRLTAEARTVYEDALRAEAPALVAS